MPENREVGTIYLMTRYQVVTAGMGQVIDISIPAVKAAMEIRGTANQWDVLGRVRRLFHRILKETSD